MTNEILEPEKLNAPIDVQAIPNFEDIKQRFEKSFQAFVQDKKYTAAAEAIRDEFGKESLVQNEDFVNRVVDHMDDETLVEKRFVFISVNQEYLESLSKN